MRRICLIAVSNLLLASLIAADRPAPAVALDDFKELLKLPKGQMPVPGVGSQSFVHVSPDGKRYIRVCMQKDGKAIPHVGHIGVPKSDEPVPWNKNGIWSGYCRLTFPGNAWRADSQRVLFLHPKFREDHTGWVEHYERTMFPYAMCWDVANPQFGRPRHMSLKDKGETGCTAASYSRDGKLLYTAFSDPKDFRSCGITEWKQGRPRSRILYRVAGGAIYHMVPSPDGEHLAWVETHSRKDPKKWRGLEVVVLKLKTREVVRRIRLSKHIPNWPDAQPPVWTADSKGLCYGQVRNVDDIYRREARLFDLAQKSDRMLARDAVAVGATSGGIVLNRGPACMPMAQLVSSRIAPAMVDDRPGTDGIVFCSLGGRAEPQALASSAYAQQVVGNTLISARRTGDHAIVMRARLKPVKPPNARKAPASRKSSAP